METRYMILKYEIEERNFVEIFSRLTSIIRLEGRRDGDSDDDTCLVLYPYVACTNIEYVIVFDNTDQDWIQFIIKYTPAMSIHDIHVHVTIARHRNEWNLPSECTAMYEYQHVVRGTYRIIDSCICPTLVPVKIFPYYSSDWGYFFFMLIVFAGKKKKRSFLQIRSHLNEKRVKELRRNRRKSCGVLLGIFVPNVRKWRQRAWNCDIGLHPMGHEDTKRKKENGYLVVRFGQTAIY